MNLGRVNFSVGADLCDSQIFEEFKLEQLEEWGSRKEPNCTEEKLKPSFHAAYHYFSPLARISGLEVE